MSRFDMPYILSKLWAMFILYKIWNVKIKIKNIHLTLFISFLAFVKMNIAYITKNDEKTAINFRI